MAFQQPVCKVVVAIGGQVLCLILYAFACALCPQLLRTRAVVALPLRGGYGVPSQCTSCFFALSTGSCLPALVQASATLTGKSHAAARQLSRRSLSAAAACHCPMLWPAVQRVAVLCECATHRVWFPSRDRWPASAAVIACTLFRCFYLYRLGQRGVGTRCCIGS
jgi:hypothetical protein